MHVYINIHTYFYCFSDSAPAYDYSCPSIKQDTPTFATGVLPFQDDVGGSVAIPVPYRFPFFGTRQKNIWVRSR